MADISPFRSRSRLALASFQFADILIDNEAAPSVPASSKSILWVDSTSKRAHQTEDSGAHHGSLGLTLNATGAVGPALPAATDTYVLGSNIRVPSYGFVAGQLFRWFMNISKTAAGTGTATYTFRIGSAGAIADTAHPAALTAAGPAQTAVANSAAFLFQLQVRTVSASGVVIASVSGGSASLGGGGTTTSDVSATFDNTLATLGGTIFVGISINPGTADVWTVDSCFAEMVN
jgi:hypothetical protein